LQKGSYSTSENRKSLYTPLQGIGKGDPVMRERTTWNREKLAEIVKAANNKVAEDPRAMNQDHLSQQPAADKYEIGGPSDFAEDVAPSNWKAEYSGGEVKRNEIGMPEMRGETFTHSEKTAAEQQEQDDETLEKKAALCIKLATKCLPKKASESMIEDQALAFMHMPDAALIETSIRLAADEDEKEEEQQQKQAQQDQQQAQAQQQQADEEKKQAGQIPENFKKKDDEEKGQQDKEAGQIPENFKKKDEDDKGEQQQKQAQGQQQQDEAKEEQQKQAFVAFKKACDAMAQGMGVPQDQVMALFQQALSGQQQQQMPQAPAQQQQMGDDQLLDQMLQDEGQQPVMAGLDDIQLEGTSMDTGEIRLGSEDEVLATLFASHEEVRNANHANAITSGIPMVASQGTTRTASTRTIGTRPSAGVSTIGSGSNASSGGDIDKLSSLWASAPDVKGVFG